jgi:hypothetical protein
MPEREANGDATANDDLRPGRKVEVRNRFDGSWSGGFEVVEEVEEFEVVEQVDVGYRVRRRSDAAVLPGVFRGDELRPEGGRRRWPT